MKFFCSVILFFFSLGCQITSKMSRVISSNKVTYSKDSFIKNIEQGVYGSVFKEKYKNFYVFLVDDKSSSYCELKTKNIFTSKEIDESVQNTIKAVKVFYNYFDNFHMDFDIISDLKKTPVVIYIDLYNHPLGCATAGFQSISNLQGKELNYFAVDISPSTSTDILTHELSHFFDSSLSENGTYFTNDFDESIADSIATFVLNKQTKEINLGLEYFDSSLVSKAMKKFPRFYKNIKQICGTNLLKRSFDKLIDYNLRYQIESHDKSHMLSCLNNSALSHLANFIGSRALQESFLSIIFSKETIYSDYSKFIEKLILVSPLGSKEREKVVLSFKKENWVLFK